jgi:glycosyltransferase involved in cell wall biosynthesis
MVNGRDEPRVLLIATHAPHAMDEHGLFAYGPYVREANIWVQHFDRVLVAAPPEKGPRSAIHQYYRHAHWQWVPLVAFNMVSFSGFLKLPWAVIVNGFRLLRCMRTAHHIHMRCPGNIGLLALFLQTLFPRKRKTIKYAGNWVDATSVLSYRLQRALVANSFLMRNSTALVYAPESYRTPLLMPTFTASYSEREQMVALRTLGSHIRFVFAGTLTANKRPLEAVQLIMHCLPRFHALGKTATIDLCGEGPQRQVLMNFLHAHDMQSIVNLRGNVTADELQEVYKNSHFAVLLSVSEGWPKAVAEAMFWGCVPIASAVSVVPWMLGEGRGVAVKPDNEAAAADKLMSVVGNEGEYAAMAGRAMRWSRGFTLESFSREIDKVLTARKDD